MAQRMIVKVTFVGSSSFRGNQLFIIPCSGNKTKHYSAQYTMSRKSNGAWGTECVYTNIYYYVPFAILAI